MNGERIPPLRMVAWEVTRRCNLNCIHCRASADMAAQPDEFSHEECRRLLDAIAAFSRPVVILTGGEPLLRDDIYELAGYGTGLGLRMVMAVNGTLVTPQRAGALKDAGIQRISVSIDGATAESHDQFRRVGGAFAGAMEGIAHARRAELPFQINTTITKQNLAEISAIHELTKKLGAVAHHLFVLVPTGRGKDLDRAQKVTREEYDEVLEWFYRQEGSTSLQLKATCAPQYYRICAERGVSHTVRPGDGAAALHRMTRGCLGGVSFCFISHVGRVSPCGYLELDCGDVRREPLEQIWASAPVFRGLRDFRHYQGKCGRCRHVGICGGCRARAYYATGDFLAEDPYCTYLPPGK